jgi:photosystem II stability/assembly factor-like uncharacterized protein
VLARIFPRRVAAATLAVAVGFGPAAAVAVNDLLLLPAGRSDRAISSMVLGVARSGQRLVAVGERGHILTSDDNGVTWTQASVPTSVTLTAVDFPTPAKGWAVGHDGVVLHTRDGGTTWTRQLDGAQVNALVLAQVEKVLAASKAAHGDPRAIRSLEYFRKDASAAVEDGPSRPFLDVWFRNEREGLVVGAFGMILRTQDGGATWAPILDRVDNPDGHHYYAIKRAGGALLLAGESGMLLRSADFGASWARLKPPYEGSYFGLAANDKVAVAFGLRGRTVRSCDGGRTWEAVATPSGSALSGGRTFSDGSLWLVASGGTVLRSTDGGKTFNALGERFEGAAAIEEAADGSAVLVGTKGVKRLPRGS